MIYDLNLELPRGKSVERLESLEGAGVFLAIRSATSATLTAALATVTLSLTL